MSFVERFLILCPYLGEPLSEAPLCILYTYTYITIRSVRMTQGGWMPPFPGSGFH